jgi:hypothetical protein
MRDIVANEKPYLAANDRQVSGFLRCRATRATFTISAALSLVTLDRRPGRLGFENALSLLLSTSAHHLFTVERPKPVSSEVSSRSPVAAYLRMISVCLAYGCDLSFAIWFNLRISLGVRVSLFARPSMVTRAARNSAEDYATSNDGFETNLP